MRGERCGRRSCTLGGFWAEQEAAAERWPRRRRKVAEAGAPSSGGLEREREGRLGGEGEWGKVKV